MSLSEDIIGNLRGYSKAMYSTWFYYKPARLLLDGGEGACSTLGNFVFGIEEVFLTHGHYDHISGVPGVIYSRASARGDKKKPLTIYYPAGDELIRLQRDYVLKSSGRLPYELNWEPIEPGQEVPLGRDRDRGFVRGFATPHQRRTLSLGYRIMETRKRLRPEYAGLEGHEIATIAREKGRDAISEAYDHVLLAYGGDSMPIDPSDVAGAEVLLHDATFLHREDREGNTHASMDEAFEVAEAANVKALALFHVSSRYTRREIEKRVLQLIQQYDFKPAVTLMMLWRKTTFRVGKIVRSQ